VKRAVLAIIFSALAVLPAGCGWDGHGHELRGRVTYGGQPVPAGRILFEPDANQGNDGPGTVADISQGQFRTRPGKGVTGGSYRVTVFGTDGTTATETHDNSLFPPFRTTIDLPADQTVYNFEIPANPRGTAP